MMRTRNLSKETRNNWAIDFLVFAGAILASLTGIYFLYLPVGGFQGGRNPMYGVRILFDRSTWSDLHMWGGILMIVAAVIHIAIHWKWIVTMTKKVGTDLFTRSSKLNSRSRLNAALNAVVALSFLFAALSGIYLLFFPGGANRVPGSDILWTAETWDLVHTWSGIVMIAAGIVHFAIHWRWVVKVTSRVFDGVLPLSQGS